MTPLASVMLLAFLFVIASALLIWVLLLPRAKPEPKPKREQDAAAADTVAARPPRPERTVSNDDVRGAKVVAPKRDAVPDDAFERFLRAGRDDERR